MTKTVHFSAVELDTIIKRCCDDEFTCYISYYGNKVSVSLEKGSSYSGKMHMKFSAEGNTASEAFEKAFLNFPINPVGAVWDSKRLEAHHSAPIDSTADEIPF